MRVQQQDLHSVYLGLEMGYIGSAAGICKMTINCTVVAASDTNAGLQERQRCCNSLVTGPITYFLRGCYFFGVSTMASLGAASSWAEAKAVLQDLHLLHSDDCMHLKYEVIEIA